MLQYCPFKVVSSFSLLETIPEDAARECVTRFSTPVFLYNLCMAPLNNGPDRVTSFLPQSEP